MDATRSKRNLLAALSRAARGDQRERAKHRHRHGGANRQRGSHRLRLQRLLAAARAAVALLQQQSPHGRTQAVHGREAGGAGTTRRGWERPLAEINGGSGLPSDVKVLDEVKTIWATTIASRWLFGTEMRGRLEKRGYECHVASGLIDVYCEGFCFRLLPYTEREVEMASRMVRSKELSPEEYRRRFLQFEFLPPHQAILKNATLQNPAFLPALRLFKLWASAQMLTQSIPEVLLDELMLAVFAKAPAPYHPVTAFYRALRLLVSFPWSESSLLIDPNQVLSQTQKQELMKAVDEERQKATRKWACCIVSPSDRHSDLTQAVELAAWSRLQSLAAASLREAQRVWLTLESPLSLLTPALQDFDVVLSLQEAYLTPAPKWIREIGGHVSGRGAAYLCKEFKNVMMDRNRFQIGYEPERVVLEAVKAIVESGGVVMMNTLWGTKIGIAWNPGYFLPATMNMASVNNTIPVAKGTGTSREDVMLVRDVFDMVHQIKDSLGEVCTSIQFN